MKWFAMWLLVIVMAALSVALFGCRDTVDKTTYYNGDGGIDRIVENSSRLPTSGKSVDLKTDVYAVAASLVDAKTGNISPHLDLGFFKLWYNSFPVLPGQPYYICNEEYSSSWWNWVSFFSSEKRDDKASIIQKTTIWVGFIPDSARALNVKTKTGPGVSISGDGFESESIKVSVTK